MNDVKFVNNFRLELKMSFTGTMDEKYVDDKL